MRESSASRANAGSRRFAQVRVLARGVEERFGIEDPAHDLVHRLRALGAAPFDERAYRTDERAEACRGHAIDAARCLERIFDSPDTHQRDQSDIAIPADVQLKGVVYGDRGAMLEAEFIGTHVGAFEGIAASHRNVRVPYAVAYDVDAAGIKALRLYFPMDQLMRQIGAGEAVEAGARG